MKILTIAMAVVWCVTPLAAIAAGGASKVLRAEELQDRGDRNHRQHFLYDLEYQPETGAARGTDGVASPASDCADERVRVSRGDGTTSVARIDMCR
jgi:hypothetical protein